MSKKKGNKLFATAMVGAMAVSMVGAMPTVNAEENINAVNTYSDEVSSLAPTVKNADARLYTNGADTSVLAYYSRILSYTNKAHGYWDDSFSYAHLNLYSEFFNSNDKKENIKYHYKVTNTDPNSKANILKVMVSEKNGSFIVLNDEVGTAELELWIEDSYGVSEKVKKTVTVYKEGNSNLSDVVIFPEEAEKIKTIYVPTGKETTIDLNPYFTGQMINSTVKYVAGSTEPIISIVGNLLTLRGENQTSMRISVGTSSSGGWASSSGSNLLTFNVVFTNNMPTSELALSVKDDVVIKDKEVKLGETLDINFGDYFDLSEKLPTTEYVVEIGNKKIISSTTDINGIVSVLGKKIGTSNIKLYTTDIDGYGDSVDFDIKVVDESKDSEDKKDEPKPLFNEYQTYDMTIQIPKDNVDTNDLILSGFFSKFDKDAKLTYEITDTVKNDSIEYNFNEENQTISVLGKNKGFSSIQIKATDEKGNSATALVIVDTVKDLNYTLNGIYNGIIYAGTETYNVPLNEVFGTTESKEKLNYSVEVTKNDSTNKAMSIQNILSKKVLADITNQLTDLPSEVSTKILFENDDITVSLVNERLVVDGKNSGNYTIKVNAEKEDGTKLNSVMFDLEVKSANSQGGEGTEPTPTEPTNPPTEGGDNGVEGTEPTPTEPTNPPTEGGDNGVEGTEPTPTEPTEPPTEGGGNDGEGKEPTPTEPTNPPTEGGGNDGEGTEPTPTEPTNPPTEGGGNDGEGTEPTPTEPTEPPSEGGGNDGEGTEPTPTEPTNPPSDNEGDKDGEGTEPTPTEPTNPPSDNEGDKDGEGTEPTPTEPTEPPTEGGGNDGEGTEPTPTEDDLIVDEGTIGKPIDGETDKPIITEDVDTPTKDTVNVDKDGTPIDENINDIVNTDGNDGEPNKVEPTKDNGEDIPQTNTESNKGLLGGGIALLLGALTFGLYTRKKKVTE